MFVSNEKIDRIVQKIQDKRIGKNPLKDYDDADDYLKQSEKRHYDNVIQASNADLFTHPTDKQ